MDKAARAALLTAKGMDKPSENIADYVAELLRQGRASEVTDDLMAQADPQRLMHHYKSGNTGMDMPMDQASRMERAGRMGFDTGNKLYHGGVRDFSSFIPSQSGKVGPGVYMTPNERKANIFSGYEPDSNPKIEKLLNEGNEKSSQVYGLFATNRPATMEARQAVRTNESAYDDKAENYRKKFDEMGFDGVSVADERTILDPTNIRSQFARFDPRLSHLSHLSASTGGAMDFARHVEAVQRAGGQIAPSKYLPGVPRAVHADGGEVDGDGITAYHGSPHSFDKFDMSKVGTGVGAPSAFSEGLYFSENEKNAKHFKALGASPIIGGKKGRSAGLSDDAYESVWKFSHDQGKSGTLADVASDAESDLLARSKELPFSARRDYQNVIDELRSRGSEDVKLGANMYKVKINAHPSTFADWDTPISQQSEIVKNAFLDFPQHKTFRELYDSGKIREKDLLNRGVSGARFKANDGTNNYVVYDDKLVSILDKYEYGGTVEARIGYADGGKSLGLYSKAAQVIRNQPQAKGNVDQLLAMVSKAKGVKPTELANAGRPAGDTMTKEELAQHFEQALPDVRVEERGKKPPQELTADEAKEFQKLNRFIDKGFGLIPADTERWKSLFQKVNGLSSTKYDQYKLPGGTNYREHLLHLPPQEGPLAKRKRLLQDQWQQAYENQAPKEELDRLGAEFDRLSGNNNEENPDFKSSHWDTPNVLAHVRMDEHDNGKTLHVQEVQSDWGQEGRDKGFHDPENPYEVIHKKTKEVVSRHPDYRSMTDAYRNHPDRENLTYGDVGDEKPPQGPYVGNTQQWTDLALKHVLTEAAKNGNYDRVVFSPGEANADLYGQRTEVQMLKFLKSKDSGEAGIVVGYSKDGRRLSPHKVDSHAELIKSVGKENAENLLAQPKMPAPENNEDSYINTLQGPMQQGEDRYTHTLQGPLQFGGHGMVDYYKNYVHPGALKLLQQHDPSIKPESYDLPEGYKGFSLPMTDTARQSILKNGFQAFQRGGRIGKDYGGAMGYVPQFQASNAPRLAVAKPPVQSQQQNPFAMEMLGSLLGNSQEAQVTNPTPSAASEGHAGVSGSAQAAMDALRKDWGGQSFNVVSDYRDPAKNQAVGGAKGSQHLHGNAFDIDTHGWTPEEKLALATNAYNAGFRGFGFYDNNMHFDVGGQRAWGPSYHNDSIPDWAQDWTKQYINRANGGRIGYGDGGMPEQNGEMNETAQTSATRFGNGPQAGGLPDAGGVRGGEGVLPASVPPHGEVDLTGLPKNILIPKLNMSVVAGHNPKIRQIAREYAQSAGINYSPPTTYKKVNPEIATRIANAYSGMAHFPHHPLVSAAYEAMKNETMAQYRAAKAAGLKMEFYPDPTTDPYHSQPRLMTEDVNKNNHMYVYPTDAGFGTGEQPKGHENNPLLGDSGERWNGKVVTYNDLFRAVHDYFGHVKEGLGFRGDGEENAWRSHAAMYSPLARIALGAETRGQNSLLNYGPHGEHNRNASVEDTIYSPQKLGIMPVSAFHEGAEDFIHPNERKQMEAIYKQFGLGPEGYVAPKVEKAPPAFVSRSSGLPQGGMPPIGQFLSKPTRAAGGKAMALTRRFTKNGNGVMMTLKPRGK